MHDRRSDRYGCSMSSMGDGAVSAGPGRREQLLTAARNVLAKNGYERTTVSSIATKASVAQGTFYLYFPSKEALPGALAEQLCTAMGAAAHNAAAAGTFSDAVQRLVDSSYDVADSFKDVLLIANRGIELCADYEQWLRLTAPWRDGIERFLRRFQQSGDVSQEIDVFTTAMVIRDVVDRAVKADILFDGPDYAEAMVTMLGRALAV